MCQRTAGERHTVNNFCVYDTLELSYSQDQKSDLVIISVLKVLK